jgi:hypothetical protein
MFEVQEVRDSIIAYCKKNGYSKEYMNYWLEHPYCECTGCGILARPPHHIKSRGAGGKDNPENLLSLCLSHHTGGIDSAHVLGWRSFAELNPEHADKMYLAMGEDPTERPL